MKKIALLSSTIAFGLFEPEHRDARTFSYEKVASTADLSHFTLDYALLLQALTDQHCLPTLVAWNDPHIDWRAFDAVLIHSPWDYYEHQDAFLNVLRDIETHTVVLNSWKTVAWNSDKKYLQDLSDAGIPIIPSAFINVAKTPDILAALPNYNWTQGYVFKPTVSAGASNVFVITSSEQAAKIYTQYFLNKHNTLLVQPFMEEIRTEGEWSLIFFEGHYSHGVLKKAEAENIWVKHSMENQKHLPDESLIKASVAIYQRLIALRQDSPLYTRIDVIKRIEGLCVMEVEQIEPYLYLHAKADAAKKLVAGIIKRL